MATLTSANAVITLTIPGLYAVPQQLQGFAADSIYDVGTQEVAETAMGVDGILSAGFVYNPIEQTYSLQADSASNLMFETWVSTQNQVKDAYFANGRTTLPALGRSYIMTKGFLVSYPPLPVAGKILQPRKYMIRWQSVLSAPN